MAEEKKEKWLNYLALSTVIFAVCATLSTFKGGGYSTRSILAQTQASDQWAYFQSKSIKGYIFEIQKDRLEMERRISGQRFDRRAAGEYTQKIDEYAKKIVRYENEKKQIEEKAKGLEKTRDDAQRHSQVFGMAVIFLQIAILLSSIAALLKKRVLWIVGLFVGVIGIVYFANGFVLFL